MDPESFRLLGEVLGGLVLAVLTGKVAYDAKIRGRIRGAEPGPDESVVTKAEAKDLAVQAAARAAKDAETVATMAALRASIEAHEHRDAERFAAAEKRAAEQHGAVLGELARLGTRMHEARDKLTEHGWRIGETEQRLRETRRLAGIDSGVHRTGDDG